MSLGSTVVKNCLENIVAKQTGHMSPRRKRKYVARINVCGNFCGHEPNAHRTILSRPAKKGKGGIPPVLNKLIERLSQYYYSPSVLPLLNNANKSDRQQRSERREACMLILRSMLKHTDLSSLRVGEPTIDGFVNRPRIVIKNDTGMEMIRIDRGLRDLKDSKIITVKQAREFDQKTKKYKGLAATKTISRELFTIFGLKVALELEQKKAVKRLKKKAENWSQKSGKKRTLADVARFKLVAKKITEPLRTFKKGFGINKTTNKSIKNEVYERKRIAKLVELNKAYPDWTKEEYYKEAEKQLAGHL